MDSLNFPIKDYLKILKEHNSGGVMSPANSDAAAWALSEKLADLFTEYAEESGRRMMEGGYVC